MESKVDRFPPHPKGAGPAQPYWAERRVRRGKTAKDRANGAASQNENNKQARVTWQQDRSSNAAFPSYSCNGKKNRRAG